MKANMILAGKILTLFMLCVCLSACSKGISNPITGSTKFETSGPGNLDTLPIIAFDGETAIGVMGGYNLTISDDGKNAELVPMRTSAIGEAYIVSGTSFFTMTPCNDCLKIDKVALDVNENIVLTMSVKHPFPKGNASLPPSATNRLDLDVFDLALVVKPLNFDPDHYSLTDAYVYAGIVRNADGYTNELAGVTCENSILPYKICYEIADHNRFAMGTGFQPFDVVFSPGDRLNFDLYLTMAYGASARKKTRLNPTYYVPEFNRKPAWKVEIDPVSWVKLDPSTVTIKVFDWNHGATVAPNYPDPNYPDRIPSKSDVLSVTVEVPGMTNSIITANAIDTTTNGWDDPLTYSATFSNERGAGEGIHFGLVKVIDSRKPGTSVYGGESDTLVHSPGYESGLEWHEIPEFAAYQTFIATVVDEGIYHNDETEPYVDTSYPGVILPVAERQLVIYYKDGMYSHVMDLIDNSTDSYLVGQILAMNTVQVMVADGVPLDVVRQYYESDSAVIYARPNYLISEDVYPIGEPDAGLPPFADRRWHFDQVKAPQAWDLTSNDDQTIKVGVVDSGLDFNNFDGRDFNFDSSNLPDITDYYGHGTHVTGIIAASGYNNNGTLGMAWNTYLYPFNVYSGNPNGFSLDEMTAVRILVDRDCKVINISMGVPLQLDANGDDDYDDLGDYYIRKAERPEWSAEFKRYPYLNEFEFCKQSNVVLIKSAGDDYNCPMVPPEPGEDGHFQDDIPIGHHDGSLWITDYDANQFKTSFPNILFVSATNSSDNYCDFSNRGLTERISAPGDRIYSSYSTDAPDPQSGYEIENSGQSAFASGTSMAAPMVSGLAALILSKNSDLYAQVVVNLIIDNVDPGPDLVTGRINAYQSVLDASQYSPSGGNLIWAKRAGGQGNDYGYGITTLSDNSTVVTGFFDESATFGPGDINQRVLTSAGHDDMFIAKYNPDGTLAWAKRAGGSSDEWGSGITTLSDDSVVVIGFFGLSATFGQGEPNQTILTSTGIDDIFDVFIAQYNPDGTLAWAKRAGGVGWDWGYRISTLSDNSTVVTGFFNQSATFGKDEANQTVLTSSGNEDIFIARYNPDGTLAWAKRAGGGYADYGEGITTLSDNSTVVTGFFGESATFGKGEINQTVLTSTGIVDIFIARFLPDGTLAWAKRAGGSKDDRGYGITTLSDNSTVVTGMFSGSATFGPGEVNETVLTFDGSYYSFIARYLPNGTLAWAKRSGGKIGDRRDVITTLSDNSTVVTGSFGDSAIFGPGELNQTVLDSTGAADIFIARYNPDGTLAWVKCAGGSYSEESYAITTLSDNSTVVTGQFSSSSITFGLGEPNETVLTNSHDTYGDIFIARFEP